MVLQGTRWSTQNLFKHQANDTDYDKPRPDVSSYLEYIAFETKQKPLDVARVRLLYERAVTSHPLQAQLWAKFTGFLDQHVKGTTNQSHKKCLQVRKIQWPPSFCPLMCEQPETAGGLATSGQTICVPSSA